jgi:hypothetical protein
MMPYVQRDVSAKIVGLYAASQPGYAEEFLAANAPEVTAYLAAVYALSDQNDFQNLARFERAKAISDLAFRLGVAPGALTLAQIQAERTRIKNIADALP